MHKQLSIGVTVFLAAFILVGCGAAPQNPPANGGDTQTTSTTSTSEKKMPPQGMGGMQPQTPPELTDEQKAELKAGADAHAPKELTFTVVGGAFYYAPNEIHVKKGDKVKIVFKNAGGRHNWILDEFNAKTETINTGETTTVEFTADKVGTFEYYCGVGQHRQMGQKGNLIVE